MREIALSNGMVALVDDEHYDYLNQWKWFAKKMGNSYYALRGTHWNINGNWKTRTVLMHREIIGIRGLSVDHINHDGLDNRYDNLRLATISQNQMNRLVVLNRYGYKGVRLGYGGKFYSSVKKDKKNYCTKVYETVTEAAMAYDRLARELFGDRASLNFPNLE